MSTPAAQTAAEPLSTSAAGRLIRAAGHRVGKVHRVLEPDRAGVREVLYVTAGEALTAHLTRDGALLHGPEAGW
jgi:hypothetical protein